MLDNYEKVEPIVYKILKNTVRNNRFSHAYLFETKGSANGLDIALAFVKYLLCPFNNSNYNNCVDCTQCKTIDDNNYPEIKIINPEGLWIKKEQLDELQKEFSTKSIIGTKKIYIINQADKMKIGAANSILKFLEEPEENIIAILITDNHYQLLETITSRCQLVTFSNNKNSIYIDTKTALANILFNNDEEKNNFVNDSKSNEKIEKVIKFIESFEKNGKDTLLFTNKLWHHNFKNRDDIWSSFEIMILYYKDVLNYQRNGDIPIFKDYTESIVEIASKNDFKMISNKISIIFNSQEKIKFNINSDLLIDKLIIDLLGGIQNV